MSIQIPFPFTVPSPQFPDLRPYFQRIANLPRVAADRINDVIRGNDDRLFGPLEQAVAATVIITLALRTPPEAYQLTPAPTSPSPSSNATTSPDTGPVVSTLDDIEQLKSIVELVVPSPITLAVCLLLVNIVLLLLPKELSSRIRLSWSLFWPPWKDRTSDQTLGTLGAPLDVRASPPLPAIKNAFAPTPREAAQMGGGIAPADTKAVVMEQQDSRDRRPGLEERKREPRREERRRDENDTSKGKESKSSVTREPKLDKGQGKEEEPSSRSARSSSEVKASEGKTSSRAKGDILASIPPTSELEKNSSKTEKRPQDRGPSAASLSKDQIKQKEIPQQKEAAAQEDQPLTESERARLRKLQGRGQSSDSTHPDPGKKSANADTHAFTDAQNFKKDSGEELGDEDPSESDSGMESDPLMAGDYRPLRSVLKKSKKKPRQKKNIHHNYFMTMRGWQPRLIPFPHGMHPKPHHPRHTLWFDNIPKNADHLMAPPPVPKEPEGHNEDDEKEDAKAKVAKEGKEEKEAQKEKLDKKGKEETDSSKEQAKVKGTTTDSDGSHKSKSPSDGRKTPNERKTSRDRSLEKSERREQPMDSRPSKEASKPSSSPRSRELDEERVSSRSTTSHASGDRLDKSHLTESEIARLRKEKEMSASKDPTPARPPRETTAEFARRVGQGQPTISAPQEPPVDPQLAKATFATQAVLCCLLYMLNQQLAFVLMAFFCYAYLRRFTGAGHVIDRDYSSRGSEVIAPIAESSVINPIGRLETPGHRDGHVTVQAGFEHEDPTPALAANPEVPVVTVVRQERSAGGQADSAKIPTRLKDLTEEQKKRYLALKAAKDAR